jgi:hypothetical protein
MKKIVIGILVLAPLAFLVFMIAKYRVDVPEWDQWTLVPFLKESYDGTLSLGHLWLQHNEHRLFFPQLIMIVLAHVSRWNTAYELATSLILAIGIFFLLARAMKKLFRILPGRPALWPFVVLSVMVFSLNQVENWLWGWNIQVFLNILCGAGALSLLTGDKLGWRNMAAASALSIVAVYSYAPGLIVLPLGFLFILISRSARRGRKKLYALSWVGLSAAVFLSYFYRYVPSGFQSSPSAILEFPLKYLKFVVTYLGAALLSSDVNPVLAFWVGLAGLSIFVVVLGAMRVERRVPFQALSLFLALSLYALVAALFASAGRFVMGDIQAMTPRYIAFSVLFWISLFVFVVLYLRSSPKKEPNHGEPPRERPFIPKVREALLAISLALVFLLSAMSSFHSRVLFEERSRFLEPAREALLSSMDEDLLERIYPHLREIDRSEMQKRIDFLRSKKLSVFRSQRR